MATNPKIAVLVKRVIEKDDKTPNADLYEQAIRMDPSIKRKSQLSFFASYILPVRRAHNAKKRSKTLVAPTRTRPASKKVEAKATSEIDNDLAINRVPDNAAVASPPVHIPSSRNGSGYVGDAENVLRRVLTEVARDAMRAESRSEFVDLLARIDRHARELPDALAARDKTLLETASDQLRIAAS